MSPDGFTVKMKSPLVCVGQHRQLWHGQEVTTFH